MRRLTIILAAVLALLAMLLPAAPAQAADTVADGGFVANTCPDVIKQNCTNPGWTKDLEPSAQNYFCRTTACTGAAFAGTGWAQLGGGLVVISTGTGSISQNLTIPAAPATLTYLLKYTPAFGTTDTLTVSIDGTAVATVPAAGAPTSYAPQTTSVSAFAGPGQHVLKFAFQCVSVGVSVCGTFDIDSVSLEAGSLPQPQTGNPACDKAKDKLAKAKAKVKRLKKNDAKPGRIKKAKAKVRKAKKAVKAAC